MVGGVLEANTRWDIGKEVINCVLRTYPGATPVRPKVSINTSNFTTFYSKEPKIYVY